MEELAEVGVKNIVKPSEIFIEVYFPNAGMLNLLLLI